MLQYMQYVAFYFLQLDMFELVGQDKLLVLIFPVGRIETISEEAATR